MRKWLWLLPSRYVKGGGYLEKYLIRNWFPLGGVATCSENRSVDMDILVAFFQHLNNYVRSIRTWDLH